MRILFWPGGIHPYPSYGQARLGSLLALLPGPGRGSPREREGARRIINKKRWVRGSFSGVTGEWETPQWLFDELDKEFHFEIDVCSDKFNRKCHWHYHKELDGKNIYSKTDSIKERLYKALHDFIFSFKNKQILRAIANLSIHSGFHRAIKDYLQPVIQTFALSIPVMLALSDNQRSAILIGILYFIIYFSTSYASRKAGRLKDKLRSIELVLNSTMYIGFVFAFLSGIFFHYGFYFVSIMFYIVIYLAENLRNPIGVAYVSELYQDDILATALSANSQAKSLLAAIIAPIIGFLADRFGIGIGLSSLALLIIISTPLYWAKSKT